MDHSTTAVRIGLISDSHISTERAALPPEVMQVFQGVDLILHAGDIYTPPVLDELESLAPIFAARGDDDWLDDHRVKSTQVLEVGDLRIGLIHDFGYCGDTGEIVQKLFGMSLDVVVYGHTHQAKIAMSDGILLIGPGSCTVPCRGFPGSVGILEILNSHAQAHICELH